MDLILGLYLCISVCVYMLYLKIMIEGVVTALVSFGFDVSFNKCRCICGSLFKKQRAEEHHGDLHSLSPL